jgi:predicted transcriptional regulator of viral defense system
VNATQAHGELRAFGRPVIETREAAALLRTSLSNASRLLRAMSEAGLVSRIRQGLWALDPGISPFAAVPYLTAPYPAYVSLWSALAHHDMIEQIPARIYVSSLHRTQQVQTRLGHYSIHHLAAEVFGGFEGDPDHGYIATAEKALFDTLYSRAPRGGRVHLPEISLPEGFSRDELDTWVARIRTPRLRTIVLRELERALTIATAS